MKRAVCARAAVMLAMILLAMMPLAALAEGLTPAQSITGEHISEDGARLCYTYPRFEAQNDADEAINAFYKALADDAALIGSSRGDAAELEPAYTQIDFRTGLNDERYVSIVLSSLSLQGNTELETISADTFARDGMYAGQPLSLSQVLGLERGDDAPEGGHSLAESTALRLVWEIVQAASQNADAGYPDGISAESLETVFSPESDFYLDEDGNIVFFIQAGELAGEIAGVLYFPFAPAELMSELSR